MGKLKQELDHAKEQIQKFNMSLNVEFDNYAKYRSDNLKRIMSCFCYAQREKSRKVGDFASDQQKNFPLYDFEEKSPVESPKKSEEPKGELEDYESL